MMTHKALILPCFLVLLSNISFALPMERSELCKESYCAENPNYERDHSSIWGPEGTFLSLLPRYRFSVDDRLHKNVAFWVQIYTQYYTYQGVVHDAKYIDHVYEIIDLKNSAIKSSKISKNAKKKWKAILLSLHRKQFTHQKMTDEEKRVFEMYKDVSEPNKFLNAAHRKRLHFQLGQRDRFLDGLYQSGRFLPVMEALFKKEGLPLELTRLPFVESSFNIRAKSKVGASGIWQFMRSTGRLFLHINSAVDERNDPVLATAAAAKLLKMNYESLNNWPLAVTAYNHGRKGIMRAVQKVGSEDLEELVADYHGRSFGFASSNFFTELLAAIEVEKNAEKYFGNIERAKSIDHIEVKIPDFIDIRELIRRLKANTQEIMELNPSLTRLVFSGELLLPAGYYLRIPSSPGQNTEIALKTFWHTYDQIPQTFKLRGQRALKYGTKDRSLKKRIKHHTSDLRVGMSLCLLE